MTAPTNVQAPRNSTRLKVRTGCVTCKIRRVKCDEKKPVCERCTKTGRRCDGYPGQKLWRLWVPDTPESRAVPEIPTDEAQRKMIARQLASSTSVRSIVPKFGTPKERRAFDMFRDTTAITLSGFCDPYFWTVLVPQVSWTVEPVKHLTVALASLNEALKDSNGLGVAPDHFAVQQYNKAIHNLSKGNPAVEIVLLSCLLFYTFENWNGSQELGLVHLESGLKILKSRKPDSRSAMALIKDHIKPLFERAEAFATVYNDLESMTTADIDYSSGSDSRMTPDLRPLLTNCFSSLTQARDCLDTQIQWMYHTRGDAPVNEPPCVAQDILRGFALALKKFKEPHWPSDLKLLKIHHVAATILANTLASTSELDFDGHMGDFEFIVANTKDLLENSKIQASPLFIASLGLIPPLFLVASKCRDPKTRRQALPLLRMMHRQEGVWDSCSAAKLAEQMILIEERGLGVVNSIKDVTAFSRVRNPIAYVEGGQVHLQFTRPSIVPGIDDFEIELLDWSTSQQAMVTWPLKLVLVKCGYQGTQKVTKGFVKKGTCLCLAGMSTPQSMSSASSTVA